MKNVTTKMQEQLDKMTATGRLYRVKVTGLDIWNLYLKGFGQDPVFRDPESSSHNCNHCNNFIRRYGNIVAIDSLGNIMTLFDIDVSDEYQNSMDEMHNAISKSEIINVFFETFNELNSLPYEAVKKTNSVFRLGVSSNPKRYTQAEADVFGVVDPKKVYTFNHFFLDLPKAFVDMSGKSIESIMAGHRDNKTTFSRLMKEIPLATLQLVRDLISQGSLLDGETHLHKVDAIIPLKKEFDNLSTIEQDNWLWTTSRDFVFAKFKNELMGVLCTELAEGEELNKACQSWNKRVDPANYMKAVAPITKRQKEEAQKFVVDNEYVESFDRRHATLDDIKVTEIKHINIGDGELKEGINIFDKVKVTKNQHTRNKFEGIEEVGIEKFMKDILPSCSSVEAFVENRHEGNFVNVTTINQDDCKPIFKWDNPYSWTYKGNLAGKSQIKENVSKVGGNIEAIVRCSLQWNDKETPASVDFDLHSKGSNNIYYSNKGRTHSCGGRLDVDMIRPRGVGIENITWKNKIQDGVYNLGVKNYCGAKNTGFKVEIEFKGEVFNYSVDRNAQGYTQVATLTVNNGEISIKHHLSASNISKEIYGLETKQFHKVNLMCLSPNHWGENKSGNKHYFFMLDKCKADSDLRSFHSENLIPELANHRKVLEVLGAVNMIQPSDNQLAGLGFNSTVRDEIVLKLGGNFKRTIKLKF